MYEGDYAWPENMPDKCPLSDSKPADGLLYRVVFNNPPDNSDFLRTKDDPRQEAIRKRFNNGEPMTSNEKCRVFATSHFIKKETCERFALNKNRMAKMPCAFVAMVDLNPMLGCMKQTGSENRGHFSVWYQEGVSPWEHVSEVLVMKAAS